MTRQMTNVMSRISACQYFHWMDQIRQQPLISVLVRKHPAGVAWRIT